VSFQEIAASRAIRPTPCDKHKGEELAYLFYGRTAYRPDAKKSGNPGQNLSLAPCALLFAPTTPLAVAHLYPFDSGAFAEYGKALLPLTVKLADYDCGTSAEWCEAILSTYWANAASYVDFDVAGGLRSCNCEHANVYCGLYIDLVRGQAGPEIDDRRGTIELAVGAPVAVEPGSLKGLVVPTGMLQNEALKAILRETAPVVKPYNFSGGKPLEYHRLVAEYAREIMVELGYI
jgi:hypothetical protein